MVARIHREELLLASVGALAWGSVLTFGAYDTLAIGLVVAAMCTTAIAARAAGSSPATLAWASAVALTAAAAFRYAPRLTLPAESLPATALVASTVGVVVIRRGLFRAMAAGAALASLATMLLLAWHWGTADIDVFYLVSHASGSLVAGHNPYDAALAAATQPGASALHIQFPYLPGVAILALPGWLAGDVRLMSVVAFAALAWFTMRLARNSPGGRTRMWSIAALCLALPTTVAMVHWAWVDVYSVAGVAGWLATRHQHRRWSVVLLAIALTVKPTILLALVPAWLWSHRARIEGVIAAALAGALILPFALFTGAAAFFYDTFGVQLAIGFRADGLTLSGLWYQLSSNPLPVGASVAAGAVLAFLALRRRPSDLADMLIAGAFLSTAAFLLSQGAFLNYYFIPLWLLVLALAGQGECFDGPTEIHLPFGVGALALGRKTPLTAAA